MSANARTTIILGISVAAIVIGVAALFVSIESMTQVNNHNSSQASISHYQGKKREFWLFDSDIPTLNETETGMPHDIYSMSTISVYKGDTVVIHFFNLEQPGGDNHSFTIFDKPFNLNVVLTPGQNKTITFDANTTGVFTYYCTFHQPTMRGQLVVLQPPY